MEVYIKGMEMPKRMPIKAVIFPDGRVTVTLHSGKILERKAVPVPKHGRLIDADALMAKDRQIYRSDGAAIGIRRCIEFYEIDDAPTIIPAAEGEQ